MLDQEADPAAIQPSNQTGQRTSSRTAPVTQRHTVDRHHLEGNLRSSADWTGLLEAARPWVAGQVHVEAASSSGMGMSRWNPTRDMHERKFATLGGDA